MTASLPFHVPSFLETVREGRAPAKGEVTSFITNLDQTPVEQTAAFLAHAYHQPLALEAMVELTLAMRDSGRVLTWTAQDQPVVDKHSTGGVGDKISLCLAPLLSSLGFKVPMVSGRGLGFTGGTLDKLEAIPGFSARLSLDHLQEQVRELGFAFAQQTDEIAPADRLLYGLRDITATIESIPLITASILCKKLAEGLSCLVLDVKWGKGAFMETLDQARALAHSLTSLAHQCGVQTTALLTNMNDPLGHWSGNWCEALEAYQVLTGECQEPDLRELTLSLAIELLLLSQKETSRDKARARGEKMLASGEPAERFLQVVHAQGGSPDELKRGRIKEGPKQIDVRASEDGTVQRIDTRKLGQALVLAGAGRAKRKDVIDPHVSLYHPIKTGDRVKKGDVLCTLYGADDTRLASALPLLSSAYEISSTPTTRLPLITESVSGAV